MILGGYHDLKEKNRALFSINHLPMTWESKWSCITYYDILLLKFTLSNYIPDKDETCSQLCWNDAGCSHGRYSLFPFSSWWNPDFPSGIYPSLPWSYTSIKVKVLASVKVRLEDSKGNIPRTTVWIKNWNKSVFGILLLIRLFLEEACNPNQGSDTCRKISKGFCAKVSLLLKRRHWKDMFPFLWILWQHMDVKSGIVQPWRSQ